MSAAREGGTPSGGSQGATLREFREADAGMSHISGDCNEAEGMNGARATGTS